ncbi:MAG TPA: Hsp33 family molecular chaperone HslO, partial [Bacilli bacterium]|nr:Hsp33 family molecular chaperone HslO [Bacilli bacterium]
ISLGITIKEDNTASVSGGLLVQLLPDALEEDIVYLESKTAVLKNFSQLLKQYERLEDLLDYLFDHKVTILETLPVTYACHCSKEHFSRGIATLGAEEIDKIIHEDHQAEIICHYCKTPYLYNIDDLESIKKGLKK